MAGISSLRERMIEDMTVRMLIPREVAPSFRDDVAPLFRD